MSKHTLKDIESWLLQYDLIMDSNINVDNAIIIQTLTDNSKEVTKDTLFVCKGAHFKREYLIDAMSNGAVCYITQDEELLGEGNYFLVSDIRRAMAVLANYFYDFSWKKMKLIAVTGTKGKSTTAYMVKSIIDEHLTGTDEKCAILSSIENYDGVHKVESHLTTKEPLDLHKSFYNMVLNNCTYCVMEVSSQALKYDRVWGIEFDIGIFLNIGEDHISDIEHSSFDDYYSSKLKLIPMCKKMIISDHLNIELENKITFGYEGDSTYQIENVNLSGSNNQFSIKGVGDFTISMAGDFNILNAAAAIGATTELGILYEHIKSGLTKAQVSGRMEIFRSADHSKIAIVDYAHNKLSYESLFSSIIKEYEGHKIITVFGCPGNKAYKRRRELPEIAEKYSDYIFITEEDHGEEDLSKINAEILSHIQDKSIAESEENREIAIKKAIDKYDSKTVILVLGKGRETRQKRQTEYITTESDVSIIKKYL